MNSFNPMGFRTHTSTFLNYVTIMLCLNYFLCGNKELENLKLEVSCSKISAYIRLDITSSLS